MEPVLDKAILSTFEYNYYVITIFHGDDASSSRQSLLDFVNQFPKTQVYTTDSKNFNLNDITNFTQGGSLFQDPKLLLINNFFSLTKTAQQQVISLVTTSSVDLLIWQDKLLTPTQLKVFPQAKVYRYKQNNQIFTCLNSIRPHNLPAFTKYYDDVCQHDLFDLFLYLLKGHFRRQIQTRSVYSPSVLSRTYLQLIELEYQFKTGQLSFPREIALTRVLLPLLR